MCGWSSVSLFAEDTRTSCGRGRIASDDELVGTAGTSTAYRYKIYKLKKKVNSKPFSFYYLFQEHEYDSEPAPVSLL